MVSILSLCCCGAMGKVGKQFPPATAAPHRLRFQSITALDSLKSSVDDKLNNVIQTMQSSNEPFDDKVNTLNQHTATVKRGIASMNDAMKVIKW
eukprot:CAMPEP_0201986360 /NCGR_PEP_ID=MMETSP0904-20121228/90340_1 /ASSEMBLY_ACC=CAM_ASM_000553 /TAXON_ID=420261 /ORGANISM="Thalassiosira antarctica, Strain CCMP982" /LENGTH=93 /DNA_ID=CAMNT_0048540313 /DNA_START=102 /DNA_END=380 /DNA_ORIENTATION=+